MKKNSNFKKELEELINRTCQENPSNTPDFILAKYLVECLNIYNKTIKRRDKWYGYSQKIL